MILGINSKCVNGYVILWPTEQKTLVCNGARTPMSKEKVAHSWIGLQTAVVLLAIVGVLAFRPVRAEQVPEEASDSTVEISLHEGRDDLDAPFLRKLIHVRVERMPLVDVAGLIAEQVGVPVVLDRRAIADSGLLPDEPITFSTEQPGTRKRVAELIAAKTPIEDWDANLVMRLDQVLDLLLRELDMTWVVKDGVLHLTTIEAARKQHIVRPYSLRPFRNQKIEDKSLGFALSLEPGTLFGRWGGCQLTTVGQILTIRESYSNQRNLRSLLEAIANPADKQSGSYDSEETAGRQQLDRIVDVDFLDTPLSEAVDILAYQSKGRLFLDKVAVEDSGGSAVQPITFSLNGKSLSQTLDLLLPDLKLAVTFNAGELFITTPGVAREMRTSRVYDLRSIAPTRELRDSLVQAIMELTSEQWEETDQGGSLAMLENGLLVAVTNLAAHDEIGRLVHLYVQNKVAAEPPSPEDDTTIETRFYYVPSDSASDLLTALPATLRSETWQVNRKSVENDNGSAQGTIHKVEAGQEIVTLQVPPARTNETSKKAEPTSESIRVPHANLVIRQSISIHRMIDRYLEQLGFGYRSRGRVFGDEPVGRSGMSGGGFF